MERRASANICDRLQFAEDFMEEGTEWSGNEWKNER